MKIIKNDIKADVAFQRYAKDHYDAYQILKANTKNFLYLMDIKYYLLCRSIELSFKGLLLQNGLCSVEDLKKEGKYGHDLILLMNSIKNLPLVNINKDESNILFVLDEYYKNKEFEYPKTGFKTFPALEDVEKFCERIYLALALVKPR
ncbi:hypothetical protein KJ664_01625 [Patescibacteria group bacterium]|nr:hypothetical protein [Patescibacteria group bacterium]